MISPQLKTLRELSGKSQLLNLASNAMHDLALPAPRTPPHMHTLTSAPCCCPPRTAPGTLASLTALPPHHPPPGGPRPVPTAPFTSHTVLVCSPAATEHRGLRGSQTAAMSFPQLWSLEVQDQSPSRFSVWGEPTSWLRAALAGPGGSGRQLSRSLVQGH